MMGTPFQDLLLEKYLEWQKQLGERRNVKQFANHIKIGEKYLNLLWNAKRKPSEKVIDQLSEFFNDPRFYDAVGKERPEAMLTYTRRNWGNVPEEIKKKIAEEVSQYSEEPLPKDDE